MSWFAQLDEDQRNAFLRYACDWVRENDPNGYVEMPGSRPIYVLARDEYEFYFASTPSPAVPDGYGQEETIKDIWASAVVCIDLPLVLKSYTP